MVDYFSPGETGYFGCIIGAAVIDDNNFINVLPRIEHHGPDVFALIIGWHARHYFKLLLGHSSLFNNLIRLLTFFSSPIITSPSYCRQAL
jgi:hypothetical protein